MSDYLKLPETNLPCELIDGQLIREPAPTADHQSIAKRLFLRLNAVVEAGNLGEAFFAPLDIILGENVVQPDLLFISKERLHIIQRGRICGAPDLAVEILSPRTAKRSRFWKRDFYAQHRVREYWIVDPASREAEVLQLAGGEYHVVSRLTRDGELISAVLPGLRLRPTEIFGYGS